MRAQATHKLLLDLGGQLEREEWQVVPDLVQALYYAHVEPAYKLARATPPNERAYLPIEGSMVLVKLAAEDYLKPLGNAISGIQKPFGGPSPLALSLAGGLLGSGLGYGGGYLAEKLLGERLVSGQKLRHLGAALGGAAGAVPGLGWGAFQGYQEYKHPGSVNGIPGVSDYPFGPEPAEPTLENVKQAYNDYSGADATGAFYMPTIPVDAFNNIVWNNVNPNPYGTKDAWGTNEQALFTPPSTAAAVSGLLAGAKAATNSDYVSPYHVALTAGLAGGKGYVAGALAGKMLGALAGLTPETQSALSQLGLWSGLVSGVANSVFGNQ